MARITVSADAWPGNRFRSGIAWAVAGTLAAVLGWTCVLSASRAARDADQIHVLRARLDDVSETLARAQAERDLLRYQLARRGPGGTDVLPWVLPAPGLFPETIQLSLTHE